jgi:hypothetical protein
MSPPRVSAPLFTPPPECNSPVDDLNGCDIGKTTQIAFQINDHPLARINALITGQTVSNRVDMTTIDHIEVVLRYRVKNSYGPPGHSSTQSNKALGMTPIQTSPARSDSRSSLRSAGLPTVPKLCPPQQ